MELTNNVECYTYIFGEEIDGTSYVLFPYTEKHSPFCGITGTRLFPRDYSMQRDGKGSGMDKVAVVITKEPIDYSALNERISKQQGNSYQVKVKNAIDDKVGEVRFTGSGNVDFSGENNPDEMIYFTIGIKGAK